MFHYFQIQANFFIMTNIKIDESWKIELIDEFNSSYMSELRLFLKEQLNYKTFGKPCYNEEVKDK